MYNGYTDNFQRSDADARRGDGDMNAVRAWSPAICMAALIAALLQYLLPEVQWKRMAKFVTGAFFSVRNGGAG